MKKLILIICVVQIGFMNMLSAQDYEPLVRENAHWVVADYNDLPWHYEDFREYYTDGDTLVGDTLYKKVYKYQLEPSDGLFLPPYTRIGDPLLYGLLREDTIGHVVFGIRFNVEPYHCFYSEDTLYDFSITQYDTIELCIGFMGPITFDTVYYENVFGYYRKHFITTLASNYAGIQLYEGIGSYNGLLEEIGFAFKKDVLGSELKCYTIGDISNCDILTQTKEVIAPGIKVYPNPLDGGYLYIQLPGNKNQNLELIISDVYGKTIYTNLLKPGSNEINLGELNKGLYFVTVLKENKLLLNKKILKI